MTEQNLTEYLTWHSRLDSVSFHMPGHKGSRFFKSEGLEGFVSGLCDFDITEITGADNLFQPEGVLKHTMDKYRLLYCAEASYLLINGSSAGIIAAIMTCVGDGEKLILAGNCHKSAISGLTLARGIPVYIEPGINKEYGISEEITSDAVKTAVQNNPDAKAVLITSPNYYGICSDISAIAKIVHDAGMILIVDQAHGAHLRFFAETGMTRALDAEQLGADIVINSTHKTLASFTQTAVANICGKRIDMSLFEDMLQIVQSTSPSYIMMASLDINADILQKRREILMRNWIDNIIYFRKKAESIEGLKILEHEFLDISKLNMDMSQLGLSGSELEEKLLEYDIFLELTSGNIAMAMTGIGNIREDYDRLLNALADIASKQSQCVSKRSHRIISSHRASEYTSCNIIPRVREAVHYTEAEGRVCASAIIPYPPGIALAAPGEILSREILEHAFTLRNAGEKVLGMTSDGFVFVGK